MKCIQINAIQLPFTVNESLYDIGVYKIVDWIARYLRKLKNNLRNKAKVEGSICNAYLVEKALAFCEHYFNPTLQGIEGCFVMLSPILEKEMIPMGTCQYSPIRVDLLVDIQHGC